MNNDLATSAALASTVSLTEAKEVLGLGGGELVSAGAEGRLVEVVEDVLGGSGSG